MSPQTRYAVTRRHQLKKRYGLSEDAYQELLDAQGGVCAICGSETGKDGGPLHVDHTHDDTRLVRGLLCHLCNLMLGSARDNPEILQAAIDYLTRE